MCFPCDEAGKMYESKRKKEVKMVLRRTQIMGTVGAISNPVFLKIRESIVVPPNFRTTV
jgi:hypothetical protein